MKRNNSAQEFKAKSRGRIGPAPETIARLKALLEKGVTAVEAAKLLGMPSRTAQYHAAKMRRIVAPELLRSGAPVSARRKKYLKLFERVHDFTISAPIHFASEKYLKGLAHGLNHERRDGHYVEFTRSRVVVRGSRKFGFNGPTVDVALKDAYEYWEGLLRRVEARWGVVLLKEGESAFRLSCEVEQDGNDWAEEQGRRRNWVCVRKDGEVRFKIDASLGAGGIDAVHREYAVEDMEGVAEPFFVDLIDHKDALRLPSESWRMHDALVSQVRALAEVQAHQLAVSSALVESVKALVAVSKASGVAALEPERVSKDKPDYFG